MTPPLTTDRVLSTLNKDGTRHWINPRLARGRFLRRRRIVGYGLIALFVALPFLRIGGRPALLLDLVSRELSLFGAVFRPSDGFLLMLLGISIAVAVFLVTALFGRVWCGWACPQTVYLEHLFRPIERWIEGSPAEQTRRARAGERGRLRKVAKWVVFAALSFFVANVFLAYFVGVARLERWVIGSPLEHAGGFTVVCGVAALMLFDFGYFREQTCIVACPYGRLQSVLLDRHSLIVGYDTRRGEPRAKPKKRLPIAGDCVDCHACVDVCPTGIDIRDGLQMECVGCAQCIDACDAVMDKLGKSRGLVGYTSKAMLAGGAKKLLRARTVIYPGLLAVCVGLLLWFGGTQAATEITLERVRGPSFIELPEGRVASAVQLKLENESDAVHTYTIQLRETPGGQLRAPKLRWELPARKSVEIPIFVDVPRASFHDGMRHAWIQIDDNTGFQRIITLTLLGPADGAP